jgi:hypothetical protein
MALVLLEFCTACVHGSHFRISVGKITIIVKRSPIPIQIVKDKILPEVDPRRFATTQQIILPSRVVGGCECPQKRGIEMDSIVPRVSRDDAIIVIGIALGLGSVAGFRATGAGIPLWRERPRWMDAGVRGRSAAGQRIDGGILAGAKSGACESDGSLASRMKRRGLEGIRNCPAMEKVSAEEKQLREVCSATAAYETG